MVEIEDVIAFVDGRPESAGTIEFAGRLAQEHQAHLTGAFLWPPLMVNIADAYVVGAAIPSLLEKYDTEVAVLERSRRELFEGMASRRGLRIEWRSLRHEASRDVVVHARYADIAILARQDVDGLPESLALASGRPVILLPPAPPPTACRRVLVGWDGGREATRAIADALPLLKRAAAVEVAIVDHERHSPRHGQEPGADIARHLARHGVSLEVRRLSSGGEEVGRVLLSRAAAFEADLVVMGAYGHSRLTEFVFGGATRTALREARLPVLMSR